MSRKFLFEHVIMFPLVFAALTGGGYITLFLSGALLGTVQWWIWRKEISFSAIYVVLLTIIGLGQGFLVILNLANYFLPAGVGLLIGLCEYFCVRRLKKWWLLAFLMVLNGIVVFLIVICIQQGIRFFQDAGHDLVQIFVYSTLGGLPFAFATYFAAKVIKSVNH